MLTSRLAIIACVVLLGCNRSDDRKDDRLSKILDQQAVILQRLEALEAAQARMASGGIDGRRTVDTSPVEIALDNSPRKGPDDAAVTLVEFSDFSCPLCARFAPELDELLRKYPREVRVVHKQFPLPTHEGSHTLAVASLAANDQARFWQFRDVLLKATRDRTLSTEHLNIYAKQAGLDVGRFTRDLTNNGTQYEAMVARDIAQGNRLRIRGVPSIFINGKRVPAGTFSVMNTMVTAEIEQRAKRDAK